MNRSNVLADWLRPESLFKIAIYVALIWALYHSMLQLMFGQWSREDYNYGYLMPIIIAYLLWDKRHHLATVSAKSSWLGLIPLGIGFLLYWVGELGGEYLTLFLSLWFVVVAICWLHFGWQRLKHLFFIFLISLMMFPLPSFFHNRLTLELKLISSRIGVAMMQAMSMTAYREGNVIDLGFTQLQVVDACSGLRYVFPLIILGLLVAYFSKMTLWKKVLLVVSTIPISVFVNSIRIASVGFLYQFFGAAAAEGFFHDFSGWFIFMTSLGILLLEMAILRFIGSSKRNIKSTKQPQDPANTGGTEKDQIETSGDKGWKSLLQPPQFVAAMVLLGAMLVLSQGIEFREKVPISKPLESFPTKIGSWQGDSQLMEQKFIDGLDLSDYTIIDYRNNIGRMVNFYVAYYESQQKGESIHSPETCLPGSGWAFKKAGEMTLPLAAPNGLPMRVNRAFMEKGDLRQLSYFWFPQRDRVLTNAYELKIYNFWDALTRQRTDGALVRLVTPVYSGEAVEDADARLLSFTRDIVPVLNEFLPK